MVLLRYFRNHFRPEIYGPGYKGLFKQAMAEVPAPTICGIGSLIIVTFMWPVIRYKEKLSGNGLKRYLYRYVTYRPEDDRLDLFLLPPKMAAELEDLRAKAVKKNQQNE